LAEARLADPGGVIQAADLADGVEATTVAVTAWRRGTEVRAAPWRRRQPWTGLGLSFYIFLLFFFPFVLFCFVFFCVVFSSHGAEHFFDLVPFKLRNKDGIWQELRRNIYLKKRTLGQVTMEPGDSHSDASSWSERSVS